MNHVPVWAAASAVLFWTPRLMITVLLSIAVTCHLKRLSKKKNLFVVSSAYVPKVWNQWHLIAWELAKDALCQSVIRAGRGEMPPDSTQRLWEELIGCIHSLTAFDVSSPDKSFGWKERVKLNETKVSAPRRLAVISVCQVFPLSCSNFIGSLLYWEKDKREKRK